LDFRLSVQPGEEGRMPRSGGVAAPGTVDRTTFAYERLRELIVHGQLAPGTRIVETDLAERLGVSRTPVRSAVQRLQQEGFLVPRGEGVQARPRVAPLTREDAGELFGIVGTLEGLAARRAAELPRKERANVVRELEAANRSLEKTPQESPESGNLFFERDQAFHAIYVAAGAGPRLRSLHDATKPQAERYIRLYVSTLYTEIGTSVREHEEIIQALDRGAPELAQKAVVTNWYNASLRLYKVIDVVGERGSW
jgi:DNA-binding GntR family transcriptional regulator